jgi:hypothetical protein
MEWPSSIRKRHLEAHTRLRESAARLAEHARGCDCTELRAPLARAIVELFEQLRAHLEEEDRTLAPLLEDIDAWGPVRAQRLRERCRAELVRVVGMLERLAEPLTEGPLRSELLSFIDWMTDELAREEAEHLDEQLLRDDPVVLDESG